jgi:O-methyltransferase
MVNDSIYSEVVQRNLTYLGPDKIESLLRCVDQVHKANVPGDFAEFGVALGGSGICLAKSLDEGRRYLGFDVFGMIPPPSDADGQDVQNRYKAILSGKSAGIGGDKYYGYVSNLFDVVSDNFKSFGCTVDGKTVCLVKGLFQDTLESYHDANLAIAHIDCDWHESVFLCLKFSWPRLSEGGYIILDDYNDWSGCRKATDEFLESIGDANLVRAVPHAVIQKRRRV